MAQWSLSYQRQITPNWLASASYLGNKTTHVLSGQDINVPQYIPGSSASTNLRRRLFLQNPTLGAAYGQITQSDPNGNANYNALLLSIQHRFSHGFMADQLHVVALPERRGSIRRDKRSGLHEPQ